ncbi:MAG: YlbG family protein [Atopococcus tabaci]|uniref:YlbG family protein n=1 Tax=Atopococcus tabaci TaxID=269774 RepID=A0AA43RM81_9LACT|nr:YlbG family protein [Atopococcus tabaci]
MEIKKREKIYIWLYSFKQFNALKKYGLIHYSSRKMNYVVMYVDEDQLEDVIEQISQLSFVREVQQTPQKEIDLSFEHSLDDWIEEIKKAKKESDYII